MKKLLLIISLAFPLGSLIAQPQGQRPEVPPPREMNRDHRPSAHNETKPILDQFPDIPNLTLQQREKIGTILTKERSDIDKQIDTKRKIEIELREEITEKEQRKLQNKIEKSDNGLATFF